MNIEQLMDRFSRMTKPETELMRQQRELGLLVIGEFNEDVDAEDAYAFAKVIFSCRERLKAGEEIPEDLTDELMSAKEEAKEALKPENIAVYRADPA